MNKTCQINVRLTSSELELLKSKSKAYKNLSSYIIDTCLNSDDRLLIDKIMFLDTWADSYMSYKNELSHQNSNLNQITKYLNKISYSSDKVLEEIKSTLNSISLINSRIYEENEKILAIYKSLYTTL